LENRKNQSDKEIILEPPKLRKAVEKKKKRHKKSKEFTFRNPRQQFHL
jgi:hypothetical protein